VEELFDDIRNRATIQNNDGPTIVQAEIENEINKMKDGKAAGPDGITIEETKALKIFWH
jgi:hypothetical protein